MCVHWYVAEEYNGEEPELQPLDGLLAKLNKDNTSEFKFGIRVGLKMSIEAALEGHIGKSIAV